MRGWEGFNINVKFRGEEVDVNGSWYRGHGGYVSTINDILGEPPEPSELELDEIEFEGVSIYPFLSQSLIDDLEEIVLQELAEY